MRKLWTLARESVKSVALLTLVVALALLLSDKFLTSKEDSVTLRPGEWRESDDATKASIEEAVLGQLRAIHQHRFLEAYAYSANSFQRQIGLMDFESMIWEGYPELTVNTFQQFGECIDNGVGQASIEVKLVPTFGYRVWFVYFLVKEANDWKILSVSRNASRWGRGRRGR